jgi:hypothetical protein
VSDVVDVVVAPYQDVRVAQQDFDGLCARVTDKTVTSEGVFLVERNAAGQVRGHSHRRSSRPQRPGLGRRSRPRGGPLFASPGDPTDGLLGRGISAVPGVALGSRYDIGTPRLLSEV